MTKEKRILIIDDEEGIRESFKLILSNFYNLTLASNADEAEERLSNGSFDLVLLDIKMPRINGLDYLKKLKESKPSLPVIIITGYQSVETAQEAIRNGAADYIPKPFDSKQILKAVAETLK